MNIFISGVGGPTTRSVARSIKISKYGKKAQLYGTDINPFSYGLYESDIYDKAILVPNTKAEGYWDTIERFIEENEIEFAMIQPEQAVLEWSVHKEKGMKWPCKALLPEVGLVKALMDKGSMTDILKNSGLVPKSFVLDRNDLDLTGVETTLDYPFWIRSTSGSSGLGSLKIENRKSLEDWIQINPDVERFIASEFLPQRNLACKLLYYEGELIRAACGERVDYIMAKVAPSGITGNTSFGRLLNDHELVKRASEAMDKLFTATNSRKHGFFTADFKENVNGVPLITEVNVRMVAFNYSFALAGANFSEDILSLLSNDRSFDRTFKIYEFERDLIFLRDVDVEPILMKESNLKKF